MNAYQSKQWADKYSEETWEQAAKEEAKRATKEINKALYNIVSGTGGKIFFYQSLSYVYKIK